MEDLMSDLARDWELKCTIGPGYTVHTKYVSDRATGVRRKPVEEKWERDTKELGRGTFGTVWLERCTSGPSSGKVRAVKQIYKNFGPSSITTKALSGELSAIMKFSHEMYRDCFVQSFGWYDSADALYITMEYLPLGDLSRYLKKPLPEAQANRITLQILEGLNFMHQNKFAHRDLKPNNILVQHGGPNWWVKISDFGTSKQIETTALRTSVGTELYQAPELRGVFTPSDMADDDQQTFSLAVDIWGVGAIAFRIATGRMIFATPRELYSYVVQGMSFPQEESLSRDCNEFIERTMNASPRQRPTTAEALAHSWLEQSSDISSDPGHPSETPIEEPSLRFEDLTTEASAEWPTISSGMGENTKAPNKFTWLADDESNTVRLVPSTGFDSQRLEATTNPLTLVNESTPTESTSRRNHDVAPKTASPASTSTGFISADRTVAHSESWENERVPLDETSGDWRKSNISTSSTAPPSATTEKQRHPQSQRLAVGEDDLLHVGYMPDGETLVMSSLYTIHIFSRGEDGQFKIKETLDTGGWPIHCMAVTDRRIVIFSVFARSPSDCAIKIWQESEGRYKETYITWKDPKYALSAWDLSRDSTTLVLGYHKTRVLHPDEQKICVHHLSLENRLEHTQEIKLKERAKWIVVSPNGQQFAQYTEYGTSRIWAYRSGRGYTYSQAIAPQAIDFSTEGGLFLLAAKGEKGNFSILQSGRESRYMETQELDGQETITAAFSPDGTALATVRKDADGEIVLWEKRLGRLDFEKLGTFDEEQGKLFDQVLTVSSLAFSPDGKQLAMCCHYGIAVIWDVGRHLTANIKPF